MFFGIAPAVGDAFPDMAGAGGKIMDLFFLAQANSGAIVQLIIGCASSAVVALLGGYLVMRWFGRARLDAARTEAQRLIDDAKMEADVVLKKAEVEAKSEILRGQEQIRKEGDMPRAELKVCQSIRASWQSSKRDSAQNPSRSF